MTIAPSAPGWADRCAVPLPTIPPAIKREAVSYAAYRALVDLYPEQRARFDARMLQLG